MSILSLTRVPHISTAWLVLRYTRLLWKGRPLGAGLGACLRPSKHMWIRPSLPLHRLYRVSWSRCGCWGCREFSQPSELTLLWGSVDHGGFSELSTAHVCTASTKETWIPKSSWLGKAWARGNTELQMFQLAGSKLKTSETDIHNKLNAQAGWYFSPLGIRHGNGKSK